MGQNEPNTVIHYQDVTGLQRFLKKRRAWQITKASIITDSSSIQTFSRGTASARGHTTPTICLEAAAQI